MRGLFYKLVSLNGEVQSVDEVRHAIVIGKGKSDRKFLALVTVVKVFISHLRDLNTCKDVDTLYGVLEKNIY